MTKVKYVGLDVHKAITVIAVMNELGQIESTAQVKTKAENLCDFIRGLSGKVEVIFEEGTQATWLYQILKPLVFSVIVCNKRGNKSNKNGNKNDDNDAADLASRLRMGGVKSVYKGDQQQQQIKVLCANYDALVSDETRCRNRLKAIYRSQAIDCPGRAVFQSKQREIWIAKLDDDSLRFRAESLLDQIAAVTPIRKKAKQEMIKQARKHQDFSLLNNLTGFGPVRVSQVIAIVGTPYRFRTKRQFWPYIGLAVVTHSSADYTDVDGKIVKQRKKASTRGLNKNHNPQLKQIYKGAALSSLVYPEVKAWYQRLVENGTKPDLARISLARKLAAITLTIWQRREDFDLAKAFPLV